MTVSFAGNLGKDPVAQTQKDGTPMAVYSVAAAGPRGETQWINVLRFGKAAEADLRYLRKGSPVAVTGALSIKEPNVVEGRAYNNIAVLADAGGVTYMGQVAKAGTPVEAVIEHAQKAEPEEQPTNPETTNVEIGF